VPKPIRRANPAVDWTVKERPVFPFYACYRLIERKRYGSPPICTGPTSVAISRLTAASGNGPLFRLPVGSQCNARRVGAIRMLLRSMSAPSWTLSRRPEPPLGMDSMPAGPEYSRPVARCVCPECGLKAEDCNLVLPSSEIYGGPRKRPPETKSDGKTDGVKANYIRDVPVPRPWPDSFVALNEQILIPIPQPSRSSIPNA